MRTCLYCGTKTEESKDFCPACGAPFADEQYEKEIIQPQIASQIPEAEENTKRKSFFTLQFFIAILVLITLVCIVNSTGRRSASRQEARGVLRITGIPNSTLYIDGAKIGATPADVKLDVGTYTVKVVTEGYGRWVEEIDIKANETTVPKIRLVKNTGIIKIPDVPNGIWYLNGKKQGGTPMSAELEEGMYTVKVVADGYERWVKKVEVRSGETVMPEIKLVKNTGMIKLVSMPKGTWYLNGQKQGNTPAEKELKPGTYNVKIVADGYIAWQRKLTVQPRRVLEKNVVLVSRAEKETQYAAEALAQRTPAQLSEAERVMRLSEEARRSAAMDAAKAEREQALAEHSRQQELLMREMAEAQANARREAEERQRQAEAAAKKAHDNAIANAVVGTVLQVLPALIR